MPFRVHSADILLGMKKGYTLVYPRLGLAGYTVKERSVAVNKLLEEEPDFKAILR